MLGNYITLYKKGTGLRPVPFLIYSKIRSFILTGAVSPHDIKRNFKSPSKGGGHLFIKRGKFSPALSCLISISKRVLGTFSFAKVSNFLHWYTDVYLSIYFLIKSLTSGQIDSSYVLRIVWKLREIYVKSIEVPAYQKLFTYVFSLSTYWFMRNDVDFSVLRHCFLFFKKYHKSQFNFFPFSKIAQNFISVKAFLIKQYSVKTLK